eukprot:TRINITY_DN362_c5_g1_i1.p2 TRINITY_DN362_c5_g1~~TRINITY_DN362_c5_g1_i1.p2  ORF type:complete len:359 (-),score=124.61 TRINITY_DN362_c5_g1_i1:1940-3016(-)
MEQEDKHTKKQGVIVEEDAIIRFSNVHKTYLLGVEGIPALRGVSFTVKRGEWVIIYGTSGGGKTTLLNILGTIDKPTKGNVWILGTDINEQTKDKQLAHLRLKQMGFVFQTFNLLSSLTAIENVMIPMVILGKLRKKERIARAEKLLAMVGLENRRDHLPSQLSGGEQQRVTIARALANSPEVILLDEPTGDLDTYNTLVVLDMLVRLNMEEGISLVMVTHDPSVKNLATRVVHIRDGKIHGTEEIEHAERVQQMEKIRSDLRAQDGVHWLLGGVDGEEKVSTFTDKTEIRQPETYLAYEAMERVVREKDACEEEDIAADEESGGETSTPEEKEALRIRKKATHDGVHFRSSGMEDEE